METNERKRLVGLLRMAGNFYEGDYPDGQNISETKDRIFARGVLSNFSVGWFSSVRLVDDEVGEILFQNLDRKLLHEISDITVGEVKDILLGERGILWIEKYRETLSPEAVSVLIKIMTNEELSFVAQKIFNPIESDGSVGSSTHFGSRIQPNSAGDNEDEILFSILDALALGCGDVMIGLNPACDDVPTVMRLVDLLAGVVEHLGIPTRWCVLSDMIKLTKARKLGAKVDLGFQSLAGTSSALLGMIGVDAYDILEMSKGFNGLYFEIGMGLEVTNGNNEGVDMRTLTCRAAGLARAIQKQTGKWTVVNTVTNFIGPEIFCTIPQLYRASLEDVMMMKLLGLTGGIDVCVPFHMGIPPAQLLKITESIVRDSHPSFVMSIQSGIDKMLGYETTPTRLYYPLAEKNKWKMTENMEHWLTGIQVLQNGKVSSDTSDRVLFLYLKYRKNYGDSRNFLNIYLEALKKIADLQKKDFDIGNLVLSDVIFPMQVLHSIDSIYRNAEASFRSEIDIAVVRDISMNPLSVQTQCENFDEYLRYPLKGNVLEKCDENTVRYMYECGTPDIQYVFSDGLNANALNENLRKVVPALTKGLQESGFCVGDTHVYVKHGRVRVGYTIGALLSVPLIVHFIGERAGTGLDMLSVYITYGKNHFHTNMNHSETTAICGIHKSGKKPEIAVQEMVLLIRLMFTKQSTGVSLVSKKKLK